MDTALQAGWGAHVRQFSNICFISALNCSTSVYSDCQTTATSVKCRTKMRTKNKKENKKQRGLAHLDLVGNLADVHRGRDDRVIVRIDLRIHGLRKDVGVLLVSYLRSHPINAMWWKVWARVSAHHVQNRLEPLIGVARQRARRLPFLAPPACWLWRRPLLPRWRPRGGRLRLRVCSACPARKASERVGSRLAQGRGQSSGISWGRTLLLRALALLARYRQLELVRVGKVDRHLAQRFAQHSRVSTAQTWSAQVQKLQGVAP